MIKKICEYFAIFLSVLFLTFCVFLADVITCNDKYTENAGKNIVVLTGGRHRISYMLRLLREHNPQNIFISGVHEKTTLKNIFGNTDLTGVQIILGRQAKNTEGNAIEIREWVKNNGINSIVLVTSDYHMRRSRMEIRHVCADLQVFPCAVKSKFNWRFIKNCLHEFYKVIYVYCKNF